MGFISIILLRIKNKIRLCGKCGHVYWESKMCGPCKKCGFGGSFVAVNTFSSWKKAIFRLAYGSFIFGVIILIVLGIIIILIQLQIGKIYRSNTVMPVVIEKPVELEAGNLDIIYSYNTLGCGGGLADIGIDNVRNGN